MIMCDFCGRPMDKVNMMIQGETGHICEVCALDVAKCVLDHIEKNIGLVKMPKKPEVET